MLPQVAATTANNGRCSRPRGLADLLARLRYYWRLWVWRDWFKQRKENQERDRSAQQYIMQLVRSRLKKPYKISDFLRKNPRPLIAVTSYVDGLERFFPGGRLCSFVDDKDDARSADILICWHYRDLNLLAASAKSTGQPLLLAEDAFLKSILTAARPGLKRYMSNIAVFFDDLGYHYAAANPSRLEALLNSADLSYEEIRRGAAIREKLVNNFLTKYNHQPAQKV